MIDSFHADAMAAMRSASVTPPVFDRSGCRIVIDAIVDDARELEARVVVLAGGERHAPERGRERVAAMVVGGNGSSSQPTPSASSAGMAARASATE